MLGCSPCYPRPVTTLYRTIFGSLRDSELASPALTDDAQTLTYGELRTRVQAVAAALRARGLRRGEVLALCLPNSAEFAALFHGALLAGAVVTPMHPALSESDRRWQMEQSGAQWFVDADAAHDLLHPGDAAALPSAELARRAAELDAEAGPGDLAVIPFSSGTTTGRASGVRLRQHHLCTNVEQALPRMQGLGLRPEWAMLAPLPMSHIYGLTVELNMALRHRNHILTSARFHVSHVLDLCERFGAQWASVAPPILLALRQAAQDPETRRRLRSLRVLLSGAAPLDGELAREVSRLTGAQVVQGYGLSEASPVTHVSLPGQEDPAAIGTPVEGTEIRVVSPEDPQKVLGPGELGEMWVRGPQVMDGYLDGSGVDEDGWLRTGDLVRVDERGMTWVIDRAKELIYYHGFQVPPAELEALLLQYPGIAQAAVTAGYDEQGEEYPRAFVVPDPGTELHPEEIMTWVAERVTPYKKIRRVDVRAEIPVSPSGKILRRLLRTENRSHVRPLWQTGPHEEDSTP